jgi:23S rRNA (adenine2503-C2)-methyltransferase
MDKTDIRTLTPAALAAFLEARGEPPFRARQVEQWLWQKGVVAIDEMTNLPAATRVLLHEHFHLRPARVVTTRESRDGTVKLGVALHDGPLVEMVLIPDGRRSTACISTQAGCKLRCAFCATGTLGFTRDLDAGEIFDQVVIARRRLEEQGRRLDNVVLMGMGEPLLNLDNVLDALRRVTAPGGLGISPRRVTLSTAGIPDGIRRLADEMPRVQLAVSLHAAVDATRDRLLPVNRAYPLALLSDAIAYFVERGGDRPTIEYLLLDRVNDSPADAAALARFCRRFPVKVNVIEYNPVDGGDYRPATPVARDRFTRFLEEKNMVVNTRRARGQDIDAACGQLANKHR